MVVWSQVFVLSAMMARAHEEEAEHLTVDRKRQKGRGWDQA